MFPPSCNTGGKVPAVPVTVDWLNLTWLPEVSGCFPGDAAAFLETVAPGVVWEDGKGLHGYERSLRSRERGAAICWGGDSQRGTAWLQLSGEFFKHATPEGMVWLALFVLDVHACITRIDLCADFFAGEYTVDEALAGYKTGDTFKQGGRTPSAALAGDWVNCVEGRTLYVGKRKNGKLIRIYEKGKQLGDLSSRWVRVEVEIRNVDRMIPLAVFDDPASYFAGVANWPFPVLSAPVRIKTRVEVERIAVAKLTHEARRAYGTLVYQLSGQMDQSELLATLRRPGSPRRLVGLNGEALRKQGNAFIDFEVAEAFKRQEVL